MSTNSKLPIKCGRSVWLAVHFENRAIFSINHHLTNIKNFERKCTILVHVYTL